MLLLLSLTGQYSCSSEKEGPAPTLAEAMEAEYSGIYDSPVQLTGGRYKGEPFVKDSAARPTLKLLGELCVQGDLDGDGREESVVLLLENSGGSASFPYIALLERREGIVTNTWTGPVGDRVQVRSLRVDSGTLMMEVIQHGPGEPMCCPTEKALRNWVMDGRELVEGVPVVTGTVSVADLEGVEWILESFGPDEAYPGDPPVTIIFGKEKVSGSGGCNRYFAEITEIAPRVIKFGMIGGTRMACGDDVARVEDRFLDTVGGAVGYGFLAGKLSLTCRVEDRIVTLLFGSGAAE